MRALPTLVEDLFDVVGRPYDGVDHVVLDDVCETMLDPTKSDHPLPTVGVVAQTPCDVAANLNLHSGLAEVDIAVVAQLKAHHVLHDPVKPLRIADKKVRRSEAIREVGEETGRPSGPAVGFQNDSGLPQGPAAPFTGRLLTRQTGCDRRSLAGMIGGGGTLGGSPCPA
jgi:hypothetical protein